MSFSFNRTRSQIANLVLNTGGVLAAGQSAGSADAELVYEAIDLRLKESHKLGIVWRKVDPLPYSFTVTAGSNSASATADILFPILMTIRDTDTDIPVKLIGPKTYNEIMSKTDTGLPEVALWTGGANFTFHPVPTATTTARLTYEKYADDTSSGAVIDMDVSMLRSFRDIIRYDVGDAFGKSEQTMVRWKTDSEQAERNIRKLGALRIDYEPVRIDDYDRPDRVFPDYGA